MLGDCVSFGILFNLVDISFELIQFRTGVYFYERNEILVTKKWVGQFCRVICLDILFNVQSDSLADKTMHC